MSYCEDSGYQIGLVPTQMTTLRNLGVPPPDQVVYKPAGIYYVRGDFHRVSDGSASCEWVWDTISLARLYKVLDLLGGSESVNLYVITDKRDATFPNPETSFSMFSAIMWKPIITGEEGVFVAKSPYTIQTLKLQFVYMVELTGYL